MNDSQENLQQALETNGPQEDPGRSNEIPNPSNMAIRPVRQSASKEHFLQALSLNMAHPADREIFTTMWVSQWSRHNCDIVQQAKETQEEATQYWVRHFETTNRNILKPEYAGNPGVKQPYKWGHLNRESIDSAIDEIARGASERSYPYYELGRSADQNIHNWVLKWLLWHVARYRDERNNKKNRTPDGSSTSSSPGHGESDSNDSNSEVSQESLDLS
jgi:hypothetical protein